MNKAKILTLQRAQPMNRTALVLTLIIVPLLLYFLVIWPLLKEKSDTKKVISTIITYCPNAYDIRVEKFSSLYSVDEVSGATWRQPDGNTYRWVKPSGIQVEPNKADLVC